ncbi:hypothetical protein GCM10022140_09450 [Rhodococcus aetherivorans]
MEGPLPSRDAETAASAARVATGARPAVRIAGRESPADRIVAARTALSAGNGEASRRRAPRTTPAGVAARSDPTAIARRGTGEIGPTVSGATTVPATTVPATTVPAASARIEAQTTTVGTIGAPVTGATIGAVTIGARARPVLATDPNGETGALRVAVAARVDSARAVAARVLRLRVAKPGRTSRTCPRTSKRRTSIRRSAGTC